MQPTNTKKQIQKPTGLNFFSQPPMDICEDVTGVHSNFLSQLPASQDPDSKIYSQPQTIAVMPQSTPLERTLSETMYEHYKKVPLDVAMKLQDYKKITWKIDLLAAFLAKLKLKSVGASPLGREMILLDFKNAEKIKIMIDRIIEKLKSENVILKLEDLSDVALIRLIWEFIPKVLKKGNEICDSEMELHQFFQKEYKDTCCRHFALGAAVVFAALIGKKSKEATKNYHIRIYRSRGKDCRIYPPELKAHAICVIESDSPKATYMIDVQAWNIYDLQNEGGRNLAVMYYKSIFMENFLDLLFKRLKLPIPNMKDSQEDVPTQPYPEDKEDDKDEKLAVNNFTN